jgi:hypothetical protein
MRFKLIPSVVEEMKMKIDQILAGCTSFTMILDIWTSITMLGWIGFLCACVNKDFERFHIFLCMKQMIGRHTADNILAEYEQVLVDKKIARELVIFIIVLYHILY